MKLIAINTKKTIYESDHDTIKECVEDAVKNGISLSFVDLVCANLDGANLKGADLSCADLRLASLSNTDLRSADMSLAELGSIFTNNTDMTGADLSGSSWQLGRGSSRVKLDKKNNERFAYYTMINMDTEVLDKFLKDPVAFANNFAERNGLKKINKEGESCK